MLHSFFTSEKKDAKSISFKEFLENYPEQEIWRFFVDRNLYKQGDQYYYLILSILLNKSSDEISTISIPDIVEQLESITIGQLHDLAESTQDNLLLSILDHEKVSAKRSQLVVDFVDTRYGWVGFEEREPGYLTGMMNGFNFILKSHVESVPLSIDFIKQLHQICTSGVANMFENHKPGEFRTIRSSWNFAATNISEVGLLENIVFSQKLAKKYGNSILVSLYHDQTGSAYNIFTKPATEVTDLIWGALARGDNLRWMTLEPKTQWNKIPQMLNLIGNDLIEKFNIQLNKSKTKEKKLISIFTFLQKFVFLHPFPDGVTRTFSMLLTQFLLFQNDLSPFLIKNPNVIPSLSVHEMVDIYLEGELEMKKILANPDHIKSVYFSKENVTAEEINELATDLQQDMFNETIKNYREVKNDCLDKLRFGRHFTYSPI